MLHVALLATFSIVARDPKTGDLGVAVQSHWFNVGSIVTWAEAGVGAVATQATVEPAYGPRGLALLREGKSARDALAQLLAADSEREVRQVAIIDARGNVAAHTGKQTIAMAGHQTGDGFSVQANIMADAKVWPAMAKAYQTKQGPLAERLLAALDAAQAAGGDLRGMQSAAILIVDGTKSTEPYKHIKLNLRVDDSPKPLEELRRLWRVAQAYDKANEGDALTAKKDFPGASAAYVAAWQLAPEMDELLFWAALGKAAAGRVTDADRLMRQAFERNSNWRVLLGRLRPSDSPGVPILQKRLGVR
jgi:uncharacterized Ntn-hydrolase superfamily protein